MKVQAGKEHRALEVVEEAHMRASRFISEGNPGGAYGVLRQSLLLHHHSDTLFNLAMVCELLGRMTEAAVWWYALDAEEFGQRDDHLRRCLLASGYRVHAPGAQDGIPSARSADDTRPVDGSFLTTVAKRAGLLEWPVTRYLGTRDQPMGGRGTVFVVFGMHRSGTSAVSGSLRAMGVNMGQRLLGAALSNPKGHHEDIDFVRLNEALLSELESAWDRPPARSAVQRSSVDIDEFVRSKRTDSWGFKDPRTVLTYDALRPHVERYDDPVYVFVHRPASEITSSLVKRDGTALAAAQAITDVYLQRLEDWRSELPQDRQVHLDFAAVVADPGVMVDAFNPYFQWSPSEREEVLSRISHFIDPSLKHH